MVSRTVRIKRFGPTGSTVTEYAVEEAERIIQQAWQAGALVVDDATDKPVRRLTPEVETAFIVDPITGG